MKRWQRRGATSAIAQNRTNNGRMPFIQWPTQPIKIQQDPTITLYLSSWPIVFFLFHLNISSHDSILSMPILVAPIKNGENTTKKLYQYPQIFLCHRHPKLILIWQENHKDCSVWYRYSQICISITLIQVWKF